MRAMRLIPAILAAAAMVAVAAPREAAAKRASDIKYDDVERILKHKPFATPADLAAAGAHIDSVLADMASARKLEPELRLRAVRALGGYPGSRARGVLTTLATTPGDSIDLRCAAMDALAVAFGPTVLSDLRPFLKDPNPQLRAGAAHALGTSGGPEARHLLEYALEHEEVLEVRVAIDRALSRLR